MKSDLLIDKAIEFQRAAKANHDIILDIRESIDLIIQTEIIHELHDLNYTLMAIMGKL